jgi:putative ABC transport system permease protein
MGKRFEERLDREMRFHLDEATEAYIAQGLRPDEARRRALGDFGALELAKDEMRDLHPLRWAEEIGRDLRYAMRQFYLAPAFTITVVLTLAVAIAANTSIFSAVRAVLLQPLPYKDPAQLLCIWHGDAGRYSWYTFSYPRFKYFQQRLRDQAELAAYDDEIATVSLHNEPIRVEGGRVSANFFSLLGVKPVIGRLFRENEDRHEADPVVILSNRFWKQRCGTDPAILGRPIRIDNEEFTVIGVLPAGFRFLGVPVDVWRSRIVDTRTFAPTSVHLGASYLTVIARLHQGITLAQFRAKLSIVHDQYARDNASNSDILGHISAAGLQQKVFAAIRLTLVVMWGAVICLLIIACANVANLILARGIARFREIGVRMALGASQIRMAQQLMTETLVLSFASVALSVPLTFFGIKALVVALRQTAPAIPPIRMDLGIMLFTFGVAAAIGIIMGLLPIGLLFRRNAQAGLRNQERNFSSSKRSTRLRSSIVAVQIAVSVMLLAATGLLGGSLMQMQTMSSGMRTEKVAMFPLDLMPDKYSSWQRRVSFYDEVLRRVETIGGIRAAAIADRVDLVGVGLGYEIQVEGTPDLGSRNPGARGRSVSPNYFRVLGIPLLRGRFFDEHDTPQSQRVVIINEAFAKKFFPHVNPIGRHVTYSTDRIYCKVVGVVGNVRSAVQDTGTVQQIYLPLSQRPWLVSKLLVQTVSPAGIAPAIREQVRQVDPRQAVAEIVPLQQVIADQLGRPRTTTIVIAAFAASALFLVGVGIYGVISYSVAQRRKEIGIRMALGADSYAVQSLVFRQTFGVLAIGFLVGIPGAAAMSRFYSALLFATSPDDPAVFIGTSTILLGIAFLATYLPARRATRVDPTTILRAD